MVRAARGKEVLIDTDVLIWMTRGHAGAAAKLQTMMPWRISAVTYMELVQGCRNKDELMRIKRAWRCAKPRFFLSAPQSRIGPCS
jgi:predicted nucleic acid-binding protein